jgi:hypothetical protein
MAAGSKAITGQKLTKEVLGVYKASCGGKDIKQEVKQEGGAALKRTLKEEPISPPPTKSLKKCLSSPSQIASLYAGASSSSNVKVDGFVWTLQTQTQRRHITKCLLDMCAATQSGGLTKASLMGSLCIKKPIKVEKKDGEDEVQRLLLGKGLPSKTVAKKEPKKEPVVKARSKEPVVKEEPKKVELVKPIFTVHIPTMMCTMHSTSEEVPEQSVHLEAGPDHLLVAKFGETVHTTELSNLMLVAALPKKVKKKPAGAAALKRPAMAAAPDAGAAPAAPDAGADAGA